MYVEGLVTPIQVLSHDLKILESGKRGEAVMVLSVPAMVRSLEWRWSGGGGGGVSLLIASTGRERCLMSIKCLVNFFNLTQT